MKKLITIICTFVLAFSIFGCSKQENTLNLNKHVTVKLMDVLTITNDTDNSTYYYYLASIKNTGKKPYDTQNLSYKVTDNNRHQAPRN